MTYEELSKEDKQWIETFYADLERGFDNYKRPENYKERAIKVLYGKRKPLKSRLYGEKPEHENC